MVGRVEEANESAEVLLGKDFGGGHDGTLEAAVNGGEQCCRGDDGLTAADVTFEQAVHGDATTDVREDRGDRLLLRPGQRKR